MFGSAVPMLVDFSRAPFTLDLCLLSQLITECTDSPPSPHTVLHKHTHTTLNTYHTHTHTHTHTHLFKQRGDMRGEAATSSASSQIVRMPFAFSLFVTTVVL